MNNALFTISDNGFALATYVMISSFLDNNEWFDDDIVIMHTEPLGDDAVRHISALYGKIKFWQCSDEKYKKALDHFETYGTNLLRYWPHMLKFEAFSQEKYDRIVFIDSDILVTGNVRRLFENDYDFAICEDRVLEESFELGLGERQWDGKYALNSGVFSVKAPKKENFDRLIELAENYEIGNHFFGQCCEQDVINDFLMEKSDSVTIFGIEYNAVQSFYRDDVGRKVTDEKVIHYFTEQKPWLFKTDGNSYVHGLWLDYLRTKDVVDASYKKIEI